MAQDQPAEVKKEAKKEGKARKPSALKRDEQNEKRRMRNRSFRSSVHTALRSLEESIAQKQEAQIVKTKLSTLYSLMDTGVKKKVFKSQKAARTKSRLSQRCAKI